MHTVPQNKDKLFYCCEALIFTQPLVYEFLYGPKHMAHPVIKFHWKMSRNLGLATSVAFGNPSISIPNGATDS